VPGDAVRLFVARFALAEEMIGITLEGLRGEKGTLADNRPAADADAFIVVLRVMSASTGETLP
jgi:hypothetical protein